MNNPLIQSIPVSMPLEQWLSSIRDYSKQGYFPLYLCGNASQTLLCGMALPGKKIELLCTYFPQHLEYPSLTIDIPAFHIFERELFEESGITPVGHPWLKPLRFPEGSQANIKDYPFFKSDSPSLHEVAVGPVHAGVIEPGHFRFICHGETVEHLEIQLGYQHRGVCKLFLEGDIRAKVTLAESIAGDTAIGHSLAYCMAVEALCGVEVSSSVQTVRLIALELERVAMHLADLSALAGDIAYLSGQSFFAALRTTIINSSLAICGSRFGKRWLKPGGINYGISAAQNSILREKLKIAAQQIILSADAMFADAGVLNRFDSTGTITAQTARELNMSGITAKATGLAIDARKDFPCQGYQGLILKNRQTELANHGFRPLTLESGDVYARAYLRYLEILQSLEMIEFMLSTLPDVSASPNIVLPSPQPDKIVISVTEGWRGRIVHLIQTDSKGNTMLYKVWDPSLHNWFALALAVRDNAISDFPLCNKSFDLSYCGADL